MSLFSICFSLSSAYLIYFSSLYLLALVLMSPPLVVSSTALADPSR